MAKKAESALERLGKLIPRLKEGMKHGISFVDYNGIRNTYSLMQTPSENHTIGELALEKLAYLERAVDTVDAYKKPGTAHNLISEAIGLFKEITDECEANKQRALERLEKLASA